MVPERSGPGTRSPVFYNPAMALDRDLSVALATALGRAGAGTASGWEMLAATGVRGLRVLHESSWLGSLLLTDYHPADLPVLSANARRYADQGAFGRLWDARRGPPEAPFDYVDLDPYGSPLPFLPTAVASVRPGGVLAITATDMMVLAGVLPGACERRYGARPLRGRLGPEGGLRVLLATIDREARTTGLAASPILAYVGSHHVRAVVRLLPVDRLPVPPVSWVDPSTFLGPAIPPGRPFGPLWVGSLFEPEIVAGLTTPDRAAKPLECALMLDRFRSESVADRPFAYEPNELARSLHLKEPPSLEPLIADLRAGGWPSGRSHVHPAAFRTTAPRAEVERIAARLATAPK